MNAKLIKFAVLAAGAFVVASWAASKTKKKEPLMTTLPVPPAPPDSSPPLYPTDPFFCYENPDHPKCLTFVGI